MGTYKRKSKEKKEGGNISRVDGCERFGINNDEL